MSILNICTLYLYIYLLQAVLASVSDLECGFSRDLFVQWASSSKNSIILTSRSAPGCLTRTLVGNLKLQSIDLEVPIFPSSWVSCIRVVYTTSLPTSLPPFLPPFSLFLPPLLSFLLLTLLHRFINGYHWRERNLKLTDRKKKKKKWPKKPSKS